VRTYLCDLCVPLRALRYDALLTQRAQRYAEIAELVDEHDCPG
jgi:hypothetical protein